MVACEVEIGDLILRVGLYRAFQQRQRFLRLSSLSVGQCQIVHRLEAQWARVDRALVKINCLGFLADLVIKPAEVVQVTGVARFQFHRLAHEIDDSLGILRAGCYREVCQPRKGFTFTWMRFFR